MTKKIVKIPLLPEEVKIIIRELATSYPQLDNLFEYVSKCMVWAYKSGYHDSENEPKPIKIKVKKPKKKGGD